MKKLIILCLCIGVYIPAFSQFMDENIYRGNLDLKQVLNIINGNGFLPVHIHDTRSFLNGGKGTAKKAAETRIVKEKHTYRTYYNAAVVYATKASFEGYDNHYPLREDVAIKAIQYATKAIEISKQSGYDKSPYMYLLRGEVRYDQGLFFNVATGEITLRNRTMTQLALDDFKKVAKLKPAIAPYSNMGDLARALGQEKLAQNYAQLAKKYLQINKRKLAEIKAAKLKIKESFRKHGGGGFW